MKKKLALILVIVVLLCSGCADPERHVATQTLSTAPADEKTGTDESGIELVDGTLVVDWVTDALEVDWEDHAFDFSDWLTVSADYSIVLGSEMRSLTVATMTQDEKLQTAVASIDVSYPLRDDEQIKQYVYALEQILHEYGYMEESLTPQMLGYEFGPCVAMCYTDGILEIYFHILHPMDPYVRDATGPTVFVSMETGEVLFIAYAL